MVGANVDIGDLKKLQKQLDRLDLKRQEAELFKILSSASLPIKKAAQAKADQVIEHNSGMWQYIRGEKVWLDDNTLRNSIGVIKLRRAHFTSVAVGYRRRGKYDGWFAHFIDSGTVKRTTANGRNTGKIAPRNIMAAGESGIPLAQMKIKQDILRVIKRLSK